jgi:hypothetical protein
MTANDEKAAKDGGIRAASNTAFDKANCTTSDRLLGWFSLAKPCRDRQQKSGWKRGRK